MYSKSKYDHKRFQKSKITNPCFKHDNARKSWTEWIALSIVTITTSHSEVNKQWTMQVMNSAVTRPNLQTQFYTCIHRWDQLQLSSYEWTMTQFTGWTNFHRTYHTANRHLHKWTLSSVSKIKYLLTTVEVICIQYSSRVTNTEQRHHKVLSQDYINQLSVRLQVDSSWHLYVTVKSKSIYPVRYNSCNRIRLITKLKTYKYSSMKLKYV